jgi:hypothetical protein
LQVIVFILIMVHKLVMVSILDQQLQVSIKIVN